MYDLKKKTDCQTYLTDRRKIGVVKSTVVSVAVFLCLFL